MFRLGSKEVIRVEHKIKGNHAYFRMEKEIKWIIKL